MPDSSPRAFTIGRPGSGPDDLGIAGFDPSTAEAEDEHTSGRLTIDVLGPLTVCRDGVPVKVGPAMIRRLLALLALHPGRTVPREDIVEVLWGTDAPETYVNLLQVYVSRLRGQLHDRRKGNGNNLISWDGTGYRLEIDPGLIDLVRFDRLFHQAQSASDEGDVRAAMAHCRAALACWRGPVLADIDVGLEQLPAVAQANQRRITATLQHAQLCRSVGHNQAALDGLNRILPVAALHERLQAELIYVLAATGDRSGALAAYTRVRTRLADELGVEPGPELCAAHLHVLRGDGEPAAEVRSAVAAPEVAVEPAPPGGTDPLHGAARPSFPAEPSLHLARRPRKGVAVAAALIMLSGIATAGWFRHNPTQVDGTAVSAATFAAPPDFTTSLDWHWAYAPSLGGTPAAAQWAQASVSGLTDGDHCAAFRLRVGTDPEGPGDEQGLLLGVCRDKWEIEARPEDFAHGEAVLPAEGQLSVAISADNVATIKFAGKLVVQRRLRAGAYAGRHISPAIYQSNGRVLMASIRSNAVPNDRDLAQ